jgi:putative transposase
VLNKVALSVQVNMKADLREVYGAPTRAAAEAAIDVFADKYGAKYEKAVTCLTKDREALLAFFDFPALMVFKLVSAAAKTCRRLKGENQLPKVVRGVKFRNGVEVIETPAHNAA